MIIIIGAGPAGLATAYYLQQRGIAYRLLEKHTVGFSWRNHYDRLRLHTLKEVSALPGMPMPAEYPRFPTATQFADYLKLYARRFRLSVEEDVEVQRVEYHSNGARGWSLQTNQGAYCCKNLVVATGIWSTPVSPTFEGQEQFDGCIMHASDYRNSQSFARQHVLVVGAGNSGTEIAVDLSEHAVSTSIAIREGVSFAPYPRSAVAMRAMAWFFRHAPRSIARPLLSAVRRTFDNIGIRTHPDAPLDAYPVVGYELPEAVAAGRVTVYPGVEKFVPGGVRFSDGQEARFDSIILATGYRPTLDIVQHELEFDERGQPRLQRGRSTCNPHLFCVGFYYPTTAGWLQSVGRAAQEVASQL
jgi:cation diffusion facilitator CzcD-associated flavoprotein CzcO